MFVRSFLLPFVLTSIEAEKDGRTTASHFPVDPSLYYLPPRKSDKGRIDFSDALRVKILDFEVFPVPLVAQAEWDPPRVPEI